MTNLATAFQMVPVLAIDRADPARGADWRWFLGGGGHRHFPAAAAVVHILAPQLAGCHRDELSPTMTNRQHLSS